MQQVTAHDSDTNDSVWSVQLEDLVLKICVYTSPGFDY